MLNVSNSDIQSSNIISDGSKVFYDITLKRKPLDCPYCGQPMIGHGHKLRLIKHPAIRDTDGMIRYQANRYICKACGKTALEKNPFTFGDMNSSYLLIESAMKLLKNLNYNLLMISQELNISTTQLCKYLDSYVTIPKRPLPESIGIDELHSEELSKRNASYICIIVDNEKRCIYDIINTRNKTELSLYFSNFSKEERNRVKYVTIDMWEPYRDVARIYFPNCSISVDPFHVIKHLCGDFDRLRIDLMNKCPYNSNGYYLLKHWNWLLTTDNVNWDNRRMYNKKLGLTVNHRDLKETIFSSFPDLKSAYELKEFYRRFNKDCSYEDALQIYDDILDYFKKYDIKQYEEFKSILYNWKDEIINSFQRPYENRRLSNSLTENINGKLRTYLSVSKGISNFVRFRKRVLYAMNHDINYAITAQLISDGKSSKKRGPYNKIHD